jgi:hypothetical protein
VCGSICVYVWMYVVGVVLLGYLLKVKSSPIRHLFTSFVLRDRISKK